jgi:hypothetical protein
VSIYGDPTTNAPVFNKYAVLITDNLDVDVPEAPDDFLFNEPQRTVAISTVSGDATVSGTGFTANDEGKTITGTGIPGSTTILSVTNSTTLEMSANASATGTPTATIAARTDGWDVVGALHEDNPFTNGEEALDETKHTAAGFGVYAKTYKNQEETIEFTALETTLVTLGLFYDGSDLAAAGGAISGKLAQRDPTKKYKVAFQRESDDLVERRVCENYAQVNPITRAQNADRAEYTVPVTVYPNAAKELYDYYLGPKS